MGNTFSSEKNESNNNDQTVTKPLIQRIKVLIGSTTILPSGPGNKTRAFCWQTTPNKIYGDVMVESNYLLLRGQLMKQWIWLDLEMEKLHIRI